MGAPREESPVLRLYLRWLAAWRSIGARRSEHTGGRHAHSVWHKEHGQPKTMPSRMRGSLLPLACDILD
jgi:hypothetical protein